MDGLDKSFLLRIRRYSRRPLVSKRRHAMEVDLNLINLLDTTYCLLRAYVFWIYMTLIRVTRLEGLLNSVRHLIGNLKAKINNNYSQRKNLLQWIRSKVKEPICITNFTDDWKNGIALCALVEALVPGSCPRYDLLNPEQPIDNLNLALALIKKHLGIDSPIESQEIYNCSDEAKLVYLLSRVKMTSVKLFMKSLIKRPIVHFKDPLGNNQKMFENLFGEDKACFAKGMGLILGVRTRRARFNIFCTPSPKLNLMIEISGPNNTKCSERITVHNQNKRMSTDVITSSLIAGYLNRKRTTEDIMKIPFFYEVLSNRIVVTYIPLAKGIHKLSIIWQGQHILDSPYTVKVEECTTDQTCDSDKSANISSPTKFVPGLQWPAPAFARKETLSLDDKATIVARRVIKQTIFVNGRQMVVKDLTDNCNNTISTDNRVMAMDCQFEYQSDQDCVDSSATRAKLNKLIIPRYNDLEDIVENRLFTSDNRNDKVRRISDIDSQDNRRNINIVTNNIINNFNDNDDNEYNSQIIDNQRKQSHLSLHPSSNSSQHSRYSSCNSNFNNFTNRSYIPTIPVKDMIQNWESKLSKNVNEVKDNNIAKKRITSEFRDKCERSASPFTDKHINTIGERTKNLSPSDHQNGLFSDLSREQIFEDKDSHPTSNHDFDASNVNPREVINDNQVNDPNVKSPESQPDSGICSHFFSVYNQNLLRHKSRSYPNIMDSHPCHPNTFHIEHNERNTEIQTSTYSGQYIDDEIPDYSNLLLGRYVSYTGLLNSDTDFAFDDFNFNNFLGIEKDLNSSKDYTLDQDLGIHPEKCEVFGAGAYYGQVGVRNSFFVSTKDAGRSYLAVGLQSGETDDVTEVSFTSIAHNRYEVHYQVSRPGYYVIFVKWGDYNVADSPFICKVTH